MAYLIFLIFGKGLGGFSNLFFDYIEFFCRAAPLKGIVAHTLGTTGLKYNIIKVSMVIYYSLFGIRAHQIYVKKPVFTVAAWCGLIMNRVYCTYL